MKHSVNLKMNYNKKNRVITLRSITKLDLKIHIVSVLFLLQFFVSGSEVLVHIVFFILYNYCLGEGAIFPQILRTFVGGRSW